MIFCLIFGAACGNDDEGGAPEPAADAVTEASESADLPQAEKETAAGLIRRLSQAEEIGPGAEWSVIAIARSSLAGEAEAQAIFMKYQDSLRLRTKETDGVLDPERPTDNAKAAVALKMTGGDPADVEGYDLLKALEDTEAAKAQGINAEIWALIASAVCERKLASAETYRQDILSMQQEDGAFTYDGSAPDVDITAMAVQALALAAEDEEAAAAVASAMSWLASAREEDGSYGNAESTAQVILALSAMGEDPRKADGFSGEGKDLFQGLMVYRAGDGFCHEDGEEADGMATEQVLCGLDAMALASSGRSFFAGEEIE